MCVCGGAVYSMRIVSVWTLPAYVLLVVFYVFLACV